MHITFVDGVEIDIPLLLDDRCVQVEVGVVVNLDIPLLLDDRCVLWLLRRSRRGLLPFSWPFL
jgi:hypothetical protein